MTKISRRAFLGTAAAGAAGLALGCGISVPGRRQPNVVFILTDDQRRDCLGIMGHPFLQTPNLDRMAREGALFTNAFSTTAICSPSRASFLSGMDSTIHGVRDNFTDYPANLPSYHAVLKRAGYSTAYIGKWHMGEEDDSHRAPFDYWASHRGQGHYWDNEFHISETIDAVDMNVNGQRQTIEGYYTHIVTDLAVDWLKRAKPRSRSSSATRRRTGSGIPSPSTCTSTTTSRWSARGWRT